jgi:hypothetical protein
MDWLRILEQVKKERCGNKTSWVARQISGQRGIFSYGSFALADYMPFGRLEVAVLLLNHGSRIALPLSSLNFCKVCGGARGTCAGSGGEDEERLEHRGKQVKGDEGDSMLTFCSSSGIGSLSMMRWMAWERATLCCSMSSAELQER